MKWKKPNGSEIEINDEKATIAEAKSLGWKQVKPEKKEVKPKATRNVNRN